METMVKQSVGTSKEELDLMVDLVTMNNPGLDSYDKIAKEVSEEFDVPVTRDELIDINVLGIEIEDRILTYKLATGY